MTDYSQSIVDYIEDQTFLYGIDYFMCSALTEEQHEEHKKRGLRAVCCLFMPQVFDEIDDTQIAASGNAGIPVIWQGLAEESQVYIEPFDNFLSEFHNEFREAFEDEQLTSKYNDDDLKRIKNRMERFKTQISNNNTNMDLKKGDLIKLKTANVPFAASYPMARIKKICKRGEKNINVIHVKLKKDKIMVVQHSAGWINIDDIECVLDETGNQHIQVGVYRKQQLNKSRERIKLVKEDRKNAFIQFLEEYLGAKIKTALTENNFVKNKNRNKPIEVKQDAMINDIREILIPMLDETNITYIETANYLEIHIQSPSELASLIGTKNIMNMQSGFRYFLKYPVDMRYCYKLKYPGFKCLFNIGKKNKGGNFER